MEILHEPQVMAQTALPYIDEYTDEDRRHAEELIEEELRRTGQFGAAHDPVPTVFPSFAAPDSAIAHEYERIARGEPMKKLPPPPQGTNVPDPAGQKPDDWMKAAHHLGALKEYQYARQENLELMSVYGGNAWLVYIKYLEDVYNRVMDDLNATKDCVKEVNNLRKTDQMEAKEKLDYLHAKWVAAVKKNENLAVACEELEKQINEMISQKSIEEKR